MLQPTGKLQLRFAPSSIRCCWRHLWPLEFLRQSPLPGEDILAGADMRCELGDENELAEAGIDLGRRQARLLELMGPPRISSATKGLF